MTGLRPCRRRLLAGSTLVVAVAVGCVEAPPPPEPVTPSSPRQRAEASWDEQLNRVQHQQSDAMRVNEKPVTAAQWGMLAEGCDSLQTLEADVRLLTAEDLGLLAALPQLTRLKLTGPVDDAALERIAGVPGLEALNVPHGVFSDDGLQSLLVLRELELLRFGSPRVSDRGMETVAALPALRFLHLIDVPITDAGLQPLHPLTQLESFYLDGGQCTDAGLHELLQALPDLHFHRDQLHLPDDPHAHPHG